MDDRSGVLMVRDVQQNILVVLCSVYQTRSKTEQLAEIRERFPNAEEKNFQDLFEKDSRPCTSLRYTPNGVAVVMPTKATSVSVFSHKRLRKFQDQTQLRVQPIPRSLIENLATSEHGLPWLRLSLTQRLGLLDFVVCLYSDKRGRRKEAA